MIGWKGGWALGRPPFLEVSGYYLPGIASFHKLRVLSFAAAASAREARRGVVQAGSEGPGAMYRLQGCSSQPLEMFKHRESRKKKNRSVCSLKYKNGFIFRHYGIFFSFFFFSSKSTGSCLQMQPWKVE